MDGLPVANVVPDIMGPKRNDAPDAPYHDELYRKEERASVLQAQLVRGGCSANPVGACVLQTMPLP